MQARARSSSKLDQTHTTANTSDKLSINSCERKTLNPPVQINSRLLASQSGGKGFRALG